MSHQRKKHFGHRLTAAAVSFIETKNKTFENLNFPPKLLDEQDEKKASLAYSEWQDEKTGQDVGQNFGKN